MIKNGREIFYISLPEIVRSLVELVGKALVYYKVMFKLLEIN